MRAVYLLHGVLALAAAGPAITITCNATLEAGSTLQLTDKLDLSGRDPAPDLPWPCAIVGPEASYGSDPEPATIVVPDNDCMLVAQGLVTLRGHLRFLVGKKNRKFDCCRDGEAHGSILCSNTNVTFAAGSAVTVETKDDSVTVNPGGFWAGGFINVHGVVNATLKRGQMTGLNGLISASGVRIGKTGAVITSGQDTIRGAAVQGGDDGTVINGTVTCTDYTSGDAGGCIAAGKFANISATGFISGRNSYAQVSGAVLADGAVALQGRIVAENVTCLDSGAVIGADSLAMSGNASIEARNMNATGGASIAALGNLTMRDTSQITGVGGWGADSGFIGCTNFEMYDATRFHCQDSYADNCGACVLANMRFEGTATVIARNVTGHALGGALCGGYPQQNLTVSGAVTIDIEGSSAGIYGGAIMAHDINLGGGKFNVSLRDTTAPCGGAIVTLDVNNRWGGGPVTVDGSQGGTLAIRDAVEGNASLGCETIEANLFVPPAPGIVQQPCSGCASPGFAPSKKAECTCATQAPAAVRECCSFAGAR